MSHLVKGNSAGGEPPAESNDYERSALHKGECSEQEQVSSAPGAPPVEPAHDEELRGDSTRAIAFLGELNPDGPWVLSAIDPTSDRIETKAFSQGQEEDLKAWLVARDGRQNLYFQVNEAIEPRNKKASKVDMKAARWLHVDVDPRKDHDIPAEQARILKAFQSPPEGIPAPTLITFSGGGYQAFWQLKNPFNLDGSQERAAEFERFNKTLEQAFGGDNCHNVDRIMRLPYTVNLPNELKRKKGREPALARVIEIHKDRVYPLGDFKQAPEIQKQEKGGKLLGDREPIQISGNIPRLTDLDMLNEWKVPDRIKALIVSGHLRDVEGPKRGDDSRSGWLFDCICGLVRAGVPIELIYGIVTDKEWAIAESVVDKGRTMDRYARRQISRARKANDDRPILLQRDDHTTAATSFLTHHYCDGGAWTLVRYNGDYLRYESGAYVELEQATLEATLWQFLEGARVPAAEPGKPPLPYRPNKQRVANVLAAVNSQVHFDKSLFEPPQWLRGQGPAGSELVSFPNGLFHIPTGELLPPSEDYFTRSVQTFDYSAAAPTPEAWLSFLRSVWPEDVEQISTLQEMMGYLLTEDTSQQKAFLLIGPPRSGKGVIGRLIRNLVGERNACAPSMDSFGQRFGLQSLIGKKVAVMSDMRMDRKTPKAAVTEKLLNITGEDPVDIDRKFKEAWSGRLRTRMVLISNMPDLPSDPSGALASRFIIQTMKRSYLGQEDITLEGRLNAELPSIFNWAIVGLRRLRERGKFVEPKSSAPTRRQLQALTQPIATFIRDCCVLAPEAFVDKDHLYPLYVRWCGRQGSNPLPKDIFFRNLYVIEPTIEPARPQVQGKRETHIVVGIRPIDDLDGPPSDSADPPF
nr:phage/plasmid primase, P4 family [Nitrosomonas nitrosa]